MIRGGKTPLYMSLRSRLDKLIGKVTKKNIDCENVIEVVNNKNEGKKHDIEATYEVLRLFEEPNGLKYLTHDFLIQVGLSDRLSSNVEPFFTKKQIDIPIFHSHYTV